MLLPSNQGRGLRAQMRTQVHTPLQYSQFVHSLQWSGVCLVLQKVRWPPYRSVAPSMLGMAKTSTKLASWSQLHRGNFRQLKTTAAIGREAGRCMFMHMVVGVFSCNTNLSNTPAAPPVPHSPQPLHPAPPQAPGMATAAPLTCRPLSRFGRPAARPPGPQGCRGSGQ
jgi:hypothetical protein